MYSTWAPQLLFSDTAISSSNFTNFSFAPQINPGSIVYDTTNWILISAVYIAQGGERYITLGNFFSDSTTPNYSTGVNIYPAAYYYIDDVSVEECDTTLQTIYYSFSLAPSTGRDQFLLTGNFPLGSRLSIYNILGQEVMFPLSLPEGNNSVPIFLSLAQGIYVYRITVGKEEIYSSKIVIGL